MRDSNLATMLGNFVRFWKETETQGQVQELSDDSKRMSGRAASQRGKAQKEKNSRFNRSEKPGEESRLTVCGFW